MNPVLQQLMSRAGITFMGVNAEFQAEGAAQALRYAQDGGFACDAQPTLVTTSNSGIPAFLTTYIDPKLIEVLVAPMKAAERFRPDLRHSTKAKAPTASAAVR